MYRKQLKILFCVLVVEVFFVCGCSNNSETPYSKARKAAESGDFELAIKHLNEAVKEKSTHPSPYLARSYCYTQLRKFELALKDAEKGYDLIIRLKESAWKNDKEKIDRHLKMACIYKIDALTGLERYDEAVSMYEEVKKYDPSGKYWANNYARLLATCPKESIRDPQKAIELAQKANEVNETMDPKTLDTLAAAFAAAGDFEEAVKLQKDVIELNEDENVKAEIEQRLDLYRNKKPYIYNPSE